MKTIRCGGCHHRVNTDTQTECPECGHSVADSIRENNERGVPLSDVHLRKLNLALILFMAIILLAFLNFALQVVNNIWQLDKMLYLGGWWLQGLFLLGAGVGVLLLARSRNLWVWATALGFGVFGFAVVIYGPPESGATIELTVLVMGCLLLPVLLGATLAILRPSFTAVGMTIKKSEPLTVAGLGLVSAAALVLDIPSERGATGIVLICIVVAMILVLVKMSRLLKRTWSAIPAS